MLPNFAPMKKTAAMAKAIAKSGAISSTVDEMAQYYGGPELGHLSLEYLLSSTVLPLGIMLQIFGIEGCCKSTLAMNLLDKYFLEPGGEAHIIDTENKVSIPLVRSLISEQALLEKRMTVDRATELEAAQSLITTYARELNKCTFGKKHDAAPHLVGLAIDSFRVASETTQDKVKVEGHATKNYAVEAALWRSHLATLNSLFVYAPITLIVVNHLVEKESPTGYGKVKDVGGGMALKFFETYRILVSKMATTTNKTEVFTDLCLQTYKNSNGVARLKIYPRVIYKSPDIPEDKAVVDWSTADARLLSGKDIPREAIRKAGICDVKESTKAGLYSDDVLGVSCVPFQEIHDKLYGDSEKLAALRKLLGIHKYRNLSELWDDGWFFNARGEYKGGGEDSDDGDADSLQ